MNKSKFLKKSLAMVLAVMLVVAMIPFSASAATTAFVNDGKVVQIEATSGTIVQDGARAFTDTLLYNATGNETLKITTANGEKVSYEVDDDPAQVVNDGVSFNVPVESKKVTFTVVDADNNASDEYVITIVKPEASSKTTLTGAKLDGSIAGTVDNAKNTISFTVPWGYSGAFAVTAEMEYPTVPAPATTLGAGDIDGTWTNTMPVTAQDGLNSETYTVTATEQTCLTSLAVGGVEAVLDEATGEYTVTLPTGTEVDNKNPKTISFRTAVAYKEATLAFNKGTPAPVTSGAAKIEAVGEYTLTFTSTATPATTKDYTLHVAIAPSADNSITSFTASAPVGTSNTPYEENGTVDGDQLTVTLPKEADLTQVTAKITPAKGATVSPATETSAGSGVYETAPVDLSDGKTALITVTAANDKKAYYQLSATKAEAVNKDPKVDSIKLAVGAGADKKEYVGVIDETKKTITFTVPYSTAAADVNVAANYTITKSFATLLETPAITFGADPFAEGAANKLPVTSDSGAKVTYTIVFAKEAAKSGKTISDFTWTSAATSDLEQVSGSNLWNATVASGKVTINLPYSAQKTPVNLYPQFTVSEGAKVYMSSAAAKPSVVNKTPVEPGYDADTKQPKATAISSDDMVANPEDAEEVFTVAVADETAVVMLAAEAGPTIDAADLVAGDYKGHVAVYTMNVKYATAKTGKTLKVFSADEGKVTSEIKANAITITVPNSYAKSGSEVAFFPDVTMDELATLWAGDAGDDQVVVAGSAAAIDAGATDVAGKLKVVMNGNDPELRVYDGTNWNTVVEKLTVQNEAETASTGYLVTVKVAAAQTGAQVVSLTLNDTKAVIDHTAKTITANMPYDTDLTKVTVDVEYSPMATGTWSPDTRTEDPDTHVVTADLSSGSISIEVKSENEETIATYALTVKVNEVKFTVDNNDPSKWYYDYINKAATLGIVKGTAANTFGVGTNIKRKDFAVMVARMILGPDAEKTLAKDPAFNTKKFDDTEVDYAIGAINYCAQNKIVGGVGNNKFNPNGSVTREQAAKMISIALDLGTTASPVLSYTDAASVSGWAVKYVAAVTSTKIFGGSKGNFNPKGYLTREQAAKVFVKASELK